MSDKKVGPPFKIIPGSIVKATKGGYYYCQTDPVHPNAEKRSDRKARYIYVHIVKMENHLGRLIDSKTEQVDHKDKDKSHNEISNLKLVTLGEHQRDHVSRGNHFWEKSPRIKPRGGKKKKNKKKKKTASEMISNVLLHYLNNNKIF